MKFCTDKFLNFELQWSKFFFPLPEFTVTRRKRNCRHCGTIFCESCCNRSVKSGPSQKVAKVCDLCNTLLQANQAPYFSEIAPQSPI